MAGNLNNLLSTLKLAQTSLVLELHVNFSKEYVTQNEASMANLNVDKKIFELSPFMHRGLSM